MRNTARTVVLAVVVLALAQVLAAQAPTSRTIPLNNVATTLAPCAAPPDPACPKPVNVTVQVWQDAISVAPADLVFSEVQPSVSLDDAGNVSFVFGSQTAGGLNPASFPSGTSRFLDVVDPATSATVLAARLPLNATVFALSPGPQGPPGVVQTVTAGDLSVVTGGTTANPTVAVADGGITGAKLAAGAVGTAQIANSAVTSAQLAPNAVTAPSIAAGAVTGTNIGIPLALSGASAGPILQGLNSGAGIGVDGRSPSGVGVQGTGTTGVFGTSNGGAGVAGFSIDSRGVWGQSTNGRGVMGTSTNGIGVLGDSQGTGTTGVFGTSASGAGVAGFSINSRGVFGQSTGGIGVYGISVGGPAGLFDGNVQVNGNVKARALEVTGTLTVGYEVVFAAANPSGPTTAQCPPGKKVLGGGFARGRRGQFQLPD